MEEKLVSTIITTYKRNETLLRAIKSVLNQTYKNIEIIVVDDNDSDTIYREETAAIMKEFNDNPTVKYIRHPKNLNGANARNTGLKVARGDYITFLDDDDEYMSERFEKMISILEKSSKETGAIFSAFNHYKNNKFYRTRKLQFSNDVINDLLSDNFNIGSGSNFILKKSVIDRVGGFDGEFLRHQDLEFLVRVAENFKFVVINQPLLNLYSEGAVHSNQISVDKLVETKRKYLNKFKPLIEKRNKDRIINSQLESLMFIIFANNLQQNYQDIFNYYRKKNNKTYAFFNIKKIHLNARLRLHIKKILKL